MAADKQREEDDILLVQVKSHASDITSASLQYFYRRNHHQRS